MLLLRVLPGAEALGRAIRKIPVLAPDGRLCGRLVLRYVEGC